MKWFTVELTARARISAGRRNQVDNLRTAHAVLPGSVIRGGLATAWAVEHGMRWGQPTSEFCEFFEGGGVFGQAVPKSATLKALSEVSCKYPEIGCEGSRRDLAHAVLSGQPLPRSCPGCQGALDTGKGWDVPPELIVTTTRTRLTKDGVASQGNLFARQAVSSTAKFHGRIGLPDDLDPRSLDWLSEGPAIRVGGDLSVMGAARIEVREDPADPGDAEPDMVMRCQSPTILLDDLGAATLDPEPALRRLLGGHVSVKARWVRPVEVGGWHAASGLPKPVDWALASGSTFVVTGLPADAGRLLRPGLGLRRLEGYGQVELISRESDQSMNETLAPATEAHEASSVMEHERPSAPSTPAAPASPAPDPHGPAHILDRILRQSVSPRRDAIRDQVINGLRAVGNALRKGRPARIPILVRDTLSTAWARELGPDGRAALLEALQETDPGTLQQHIAVLEGGKQA
ncbi:MAG: hypothetical protein ACK5MT_17330 [Actinomycetales bacterium]